MIEDGIVRFPDFHFPPLDPGQGLMSYLVLARKWRPQNRRHRGAGADSPGPCAMRFSLNALLMLIFLRGSGSRKDDGCARISSLKLSNCERGRHLALQPVHLLPRDYLPATASAILKSTALRIAASMRFARSSRTCAISRRSADSRFTLSTKCTKLTKDAFNALLKTLEEPPSSVKFILATTGTSSPAGDDSLSLSAV